MCRSTSLLSYFIILGKNNFVNVSHHCMSLNVRKSLWGEFFSHENTPEGSTSPHKGPFSLYKQINVRNGDHEWLRTTNAFILCDLFWKVRKDHTTKRERGFKLQVAHFRVHSRNASIIQYFVKLDLYEVSLSHSMYEIHLYLLQCIIAVCSEDRILVMYCTFYELYFII